MKPIGKASRESENDLSSGSQAWLFPYASLMTLFCGTLLLLQATEEKNPKKEEPPPSADSSQVAPSKEEGSGGQLEQVGSSLRQFVSDHDGLEFIINPDRWIVRLSATAFFDEGKAHLRASQLSVLDEIFQLLKLDAQIDHIEVQGHTDDVPVESEDYPTNWELSVARSTWVVRYLIEHHGFDPHLLVASGFGQFRPLSGEAKTKNRRIDLVIWHHN